MRRCRFSADCRVADMSIAIKLPKLSEVGWMRAIACFAIIGLTVALAWLNVTGAWIVSQSPQYTAVVFFVEVLAATCLVLILASPTWPRKLVGSIVFAALIYVCVENGKMAVEESFKGIFTESAVALRAKAGIATTDAADLKVEAPADRKAVSDEIAELKVEQALMASDTRIEEAQTRLTALGLYTGRIDGKREELTESAMRKRGEAIRIRLDMLTAKAEAGTTPASNKSIEAVELNAKAAEIEWRTVWMNLLLFAVEGARSAGLWAFVVWSSVRKQMTIDPEVFADLQAQADELARRKANLETGAEKAVKTKTKKKKVAAARLAIEDPRQEIAAKDEIEIEDESDGEVDGDVDGLESEPDGQEDNQRLRGTGT